MRFPTARLKLQQPSDEKICIFRRRGSKPSYRLMRKNPFSDGVPQNAAAVCKKSSENRTKNQICYPRLKKIAKNSDGFPK
jgi:hypothetical protein